MRTAGSDVYEQLPEYRALLATYGDREEAFLFVMLLAVVCEELVEDEPATAVEPAAIAESGAIAPVATFGQFPNLIRKAAQNPEMAADARACAVSLSRDEAIDQVLAPVDAVTARRRLDGGAT